MEMMSSQKSKSENNKQSDTLNEEKNIYTFRTALVIFALLIFGILSMSYATERFRVISTEDSRRLSILEHHRQIPRAAVHDQFGRASDFAEYLKADGRATIVNFIYTRCNAICSVLGSEFQQLQQQIIERKLTGKVHLISVTFDAKDNTEQLKIYAERMQANTQVWNFLSINQASDRQIILNTFGIVVVPAPLDEYEHNAAFHIVDSSGTLVRVVDYDQPQVAIDFAVSTTN
jgi:protein SCO1/2